jgi:hypothetical protein
VVTSIVIAPGRREARINGVWIAEGTTKSLPYPGDTAAVECVKVEATQVVLRVVGKPVEIKPGRGAKQ